MSTEKTESNKTQLNEPAAKPVNENKQKLNEPAPTQVNENKNQVPMNEG